MMMMARASTFEEQGDDRGDNQDDDQKVINWERSNWKLAGALQ